MQSKIAVLMNHFSKFQLLKHNITALSLGSTIVVISSVVIASMLCYGPPRSLAMEKLERHLPLDSQIGVVTMPYDGNLSAGVYDSRRPSCPHAVCSVAARGRFGAAGLGWPR